jgi:hypothetical protein
MCVQHPDPCYTGTVSWLCVLAVSVDDDDLAPVVVDSDDDTPSSPASLHNITLSYLGHHGPLIRYSIKGFEVGSVYGFPRSRQ